MSLRIVGGFGTSRFHVFTSLCFSCCPLNISGWWRFFKKVRPWIHHYSSRSLEGTLLWGLAKVYVYGFIIFSIFMIQEEPGGQRALIFDQGNRISQVSFAGNSSHLACIPQITICLILLNLEIAILFIFRASVVRMWLIYVSRHCTIQPRETKALTWVVVCLLKLRKRFNLWLFSRTSINKFNLWLTKEKKSQHGSLTFFYLVIAGLPWIRRWARNRALWAGKRDYLQQKLHLHHNIIW